MIINLFIVYIFQKRTYAIAGTTFLPLYTKIRFWWYPHPPPKRTYFMDGPIDTSSITKREREMSEFAVSLTIHERSTFLLAFDGILKVEWTVLPPTRRVAATPDHAHIITVLSKF